MSNDNLLRAQTAERKLREANTALAQAQRERDWLGKFLAGLAQTFCPVDLVDPATVCPFGGPGQACDEQAEEGLLTKCWLAFAARETTPKGEKGAGDDHQAGD